MKEYLQIKRLPHFGFLYREEKRAREKEKRGDVKPTEG